MASLFLRMIFRISGRLLPRVTGEELKHRMVLGARVTRHRRDARPRAGHSIGSIKYVMMAGELVKVWRVGTVQRSRIGANKMTDKRPGRPSAQERPWKDILRLCNSPYSRHLVLDGLTLRVLNSWLSLHLSRRLYARKCANTSGSEFIFRQPTQHIIESYEQSHAFES